MSVPDRRVITTLKYSKYRVKPVVVNGEPALNWQVPYLVSIKEPISKRGVLKLWANLCGGSIIKKDVILTAAHCFEGDNFYYAKRSHILRAVAGNIHTSLQHTGESGRSKAGSQWRQFKTIHLHKKFNFPNNDLALGYMDYPWDFEQTGIKPITVARTTTDRLGACITAGYGKTGHRTKDNTSQVLLLAPIDTMPRVQCSLLWEMNMDKFVCSNSLRTDVSEGDSGSPLTCVHAQDGAARDGRDLLVGVVSGKNFDKTTLFTRVSAFHDWVTANMLTEELVYLCGNILHYNG
ncbi:chymotrypsinogen 2-like [Pectinophora gossypiella]|uniref:chymotrypsinogen 2-like n=1 Tax=Pectinophora gossypiella TaxID=13191 RepID=UPI00214E0A92|nr:chymotrypsinogen 2-like [Pectinophora gossypiella]